MKVWMARLGPGLMLAAAAVGVSHLVQSTRAGRRFRVEFRLARCPYFDSQVPGISICRRLREPDQP